MSTTKTATDRAEINRRNAQKSTGPRTAEGKDRSKFNAVKHGLSARTLVLPGEDAEALQVRTDAWTADLQPRNDVEQYLVDRAVSTSWQLDRAERAGTARLDGNIRNATSDEVLRQQAEAQELGRRLFWDRRGPLALYPHFPLKDELVPHTKPRVSFSGLVDDPDAPDRLVFQLESTAVGCQWLLDRWTELRSCLEEGRRWQSPDKLKAIRLLGKQPMDAADDDSVALIFLATSVMAPRELKEVDAFAELWNELLPGEKRNFKQRLEDRRIDERLPRDEDHARAVLMVIVERVTARLKTMAASHRQRAEADAADQANRLSFDASLDGERLRRFQISSGRSLLRTLDTLLKIRQATDKAQDDSPKPAGTNESESVAETYNRIPFVNDDTPAEFDSVIAASTSIIASVAADTPDLSPCSTGPAGPASVSSCEPAEASNHRNSQNEPTAEPSEHRNSQNEPIAAVYHDPDSQSSAAPGSQVVVHQRGRSNSLGRRHADPWIGDHVSQGPHSLYTEKKEKDSAEENSAEIGYTLICPGLWRSHQRGRT